MDAERIPLPQPDDEEDVHWALSTASALWGRGEQAEALKWLRRAAESAADCDADARSLELFKAAASVAASLNEQPSPESAVFPHADPAPPAPSPEGKTREVASERPTLPESTLPPTLPAFRVAVRPGSTARELQIVVLNATEEPAAGAALAVLVPLSPADARRLVKLTADGR
jgi:hypothetical protein